MTLAAFPACSNDENEWGIINKPIAENILGRWKIVKQTYKKNGEWLDLPLDGATSAITFRSDGTVRGVYITASGRANLGVGNYATYTRWPNGDERKSKETQWMMYEPEGVMAYGDMVAWEFSYFRLALEATTPAW